MDYSTFFTDFFLFITGNKHIITESSARIIDHKSEYIPESPFQFIINNEKLEVVQQEDFELDVNIVGSKFQIISILKSTTIDLV